MQLKMEFKLNIHDNLEDFVRFRVQAKSHNERIHPRMQTAPSKRREKKCSDTFQRDRCVRAHPVLQR